MASWAVAVPLTQSAPSNGARSAGAAEADAQPRAARPPAPTAPGNGAPRTASRAPDRPGAPGTALRESAPGRRPRPPAGRARCGPAPTVGCRATARRRRVPRRARRPPRAAARAAPRRADGRRTSSRCRTVEEGRLVGEVGEQQSTPPRHRKMRQGVWPQVCGATRWTVRTRAAAPIRPADVEAGEVHREQRSGGSARKMASVSAQSRHQNASERTTAKNPTTAFFVRSLIEDRPGLLAGGAAVAAHDQVGRGRAGGVRRWRRGGRPRAPRRPRRRCGRGPGPG